MMRATTSASTTPATAAVTDAADQVVIPVVARPGVAAMNEKLVAVMSGWDNNTWDIQDWYKEA